MDVTEIKFVKMSQKRSPLWIYFDVSPTDPSKAKCKLCDVLVSRGNVIPKKMTTKNLDDHLRKHSKEYKIVEDMKKNQNKSSIGHGSDGAMVSVVSGRVHSNCVGST